MTSTFATAESAQNIQSFETVAEPLVENDELHWNLYPGIPRLWTKLVCPTGIWRLYGTAVVLTAIAAFPTLLVGAKGSLLGILLFFLGLQWWLPFSWAVALPHLATAMLLQCELEHVASAIESASSASDVSAATRACQERKQRYHRLLIWHVLLDGSSMVLAIFADIVLAMSGSPEGPGRDDGHNTLYLVLWLNLFANHPQLTACFLCMQFLSLSRYHERVKLVVDAQRARLDNSEDDTLFRIISLRHEELQFPVMGQVVTRTWLRKLIVSTFLSTMLKFVIGWVPLHAERQAPHGAEVISACFFAYALKLDMPGSSHHTIRASDFQQKVVSFYGGGTSPAPLLEAYWLLALPTHFQEAVLKECPPMVAPPPSSLGALLLSGCRDEVLY
ncbi:unnamed protein product [Symbiodinium sp. KB8]|nr:unnamed protein product [Symbiodinium sp. KB8]